MIQTLVKKVNARYETYVFRLKADFSYYESIASHLKIK